MYSGRRAGHSWWTATTFVALVSALTFGLTRAPTSVGLQNGNAHVTASVGSQF
jgi:hypothetical protein